MRGKETDIETKAMIIKAKMENPDLSTRDIENITWADHSTVSRVIDKDLQQVATKSERLVRIIDNDMESVENMSEITKRFTRELKAKEELDRADITVANTTTESAFKRAQIFQGKATERIDIWDYSTKTQKELEMIRQQELL